MMTAEDEAKSFMDSISLSALQAVARTFWWSFNFKSAAVSSVKDSFMSLHIERSIATISTVDGYMNK